MEIKKPLTFEECYPTIKSEIEKRKHKWNLTSIAWLDFSDVSQIILIHIHKKWEQYNQSKPLTPWLNTIISNQIKNVIRNVYSNYSRPCLKCAAAFDENKCKIWGEQCNSCPLYAYWQKHKQSATQIKIPVSMENHIQEVKEIYDKSIDVFKHIEQVHSKMKEILKPIEWKVYEGLFILHEEESVMAKKLGYISNERGRAPGYKQVKNIRKIIIEKVKAMLANGEIDLY